MTITQFSLLKRLGANQVPMPPVHGALCFSLIFILLFSSYFYPSFAYSGEQDFQLTRRDKIFGIYPVDKDTCWAVGDNGLILKLTDEGSKGDGMQKMAQKANSPTMDMGKLPEGMPPPPPGMDPEMMKKMMLQMMGRGMPEWIKVERIESGTTLSLYDVYFINERGWIVGGDGLILHTEDGGVSWKQQPKVTDSYLLKVFFLDDTRGIAAGESGAMLITENGGSEWQHAAFDWILMTPEELMEEGVLAPTLYDVSFVNENTGWLVGDNGVVLKTIDGGIEWELLRIGSLPPLFSVVFKDEFEGFAVGQNGLILHSSDGGKTWVTAETASEASLFRIRMQGNLGFIVGDEGTVLASTNGGKNWKAMQVPLLPPFPYFSDAWLVTNSSPKRLILMGERTVPVPLP